MSLCEVRIPTYKRPDLLRRSLGSLIEQTYSNWKAIVLDDSLEREAEKVVKEFDDRRIVYKPNESNLGRSKNIDASFLSSSYLGGKYAFVLEDDNYLYPDFIAENIESIESNNVGILLRNQEVRIEKHGVSILTAITTRGKWFERGTYCPLQIYARLFFCEGLSNGGLFWRTDRIQSNLQVGSQVEHSWHQEVFRTLQVKELVYFEPKPLCAFTEFYQEDNDCKTLFGNLYRKYQSLKGAPVHNRGTQAILKYLVDNYGSEIIQEAQKLAVEQEAERLLERQLLSALYLNYEFKQLTHLELIQYLAKYSLRYFFFKDPFKEFLANMTRSL
jgi:glycosyltransferase involved in cell wall biosynthesis